MQTLFNNNSVAIKEEQGKFKGKVHSRAECERTGCSKWKHYIGTEHDIRDDTENHHKGEHGMSKKHLGGQRDSSQREVRLTPGPKRARLQSPNSLTEVKDDIDLEQSDISAITELAAK